MDYSRIVNNFPLTEKAQVLHSCAENIFNHFVKYVVVLTLPVSLAIDITFTPFDFPYSS